MRRQIEQMRADKPPADQFKAGMTPGAVEKAKRLGLTEEQINNWFQQFGDSFVLPFVSVINALAEPEAKAKPAEVKSKPAEAPAK